MQRIRPIVHAYSPAIFATMAGLLLTAVAFIVIRHLEQAAAEIYFQKHAEAQIAHMREAVLDVVDELKAINRLFATVPDVSREQFHDFVTPVLKRFPYIEALGFHRIVSNEERARFEAERRKIYPAFEVREESGGHLVTAPVKDFYRVIDYVEPMEGRVRALGLDLSSSPPQMAAARRARDTGLPTATELMRLVHLKNAPYSFLVMIPVYRRGFAAVDAESRRLALTGYTTSVFRVENFVEKILDTAVPDRTDVAVSVYFAMDANESRLAYRTRLSGHKADGFFGNPGELLYDSPQDVARTFDVVGQPWHVVVSAPGNAFTAAHRGSSVALVAGIVLTFMAAAYAQALAARARRVRDTAEGRAEKLELANLSLLKDIAAYRRTQNALQLAERAGDVGMRATMIVAADPPKHTIEYVNHAFEYLTGYSSDEVVGSDGSFLLGDDRDQPGLGELRMLIHDGRTGRAKIRYYRKDGTLFSCDLYIAPMADASGGARNFVIAMYDMTATRRLYEELDQHANRDAVTGLPSRNLLRDRVKHAIAYASCYAHAVTIVVLKLGDLKSINNQFGVDVGNAVLHAVAERLQSCARTTDTVARLDGGEFVLALPERGDSLSSDVVRRFVDAVVRPLVVGDDEFVLKCRVGAAVYPKDAEEPEALFALAAANMREAEGMVFRSELINGGV